MKFSIKDFFSKYDQIQSFLPIWISEEILHGKLRDGGRGGGHYGTKCVNWMSECEIKENHTSQLIIQEFNFVVSIATLSISFLLSYIFLYSILIRVALFLVLIYNV